MTTAIVLIVGASAGVALFILGVTIARQKATIRELIDDNLSLSRACQIWQSVIAMAKKDEKLLDKIAVANADELNAIYNELILRPKKNP